MTILDEQMLGFLATGAADAAAVSKARERVEGNPDGTSAQRPKAVVAEIVGCTKVEQMRLDREWDIVW